MSKSKIYSKPLTQMLNTANDCLNFNKNQTNVLNCIVSDLQTVNNMVLSLATDTSFSVRQQYRKAISEMINNLNNYVQLTNRNYANTPFTLATSGSDDMNGTLVPYQSVSFSKNEFLTNFAYNKYCIGTANLGNNVSGDQPNSFYMSSYPIQPALGSTLTPLGTITSSVIGTGIESAVDDLSTVLFTFKTTPSTTLVVDNCISVNNIAYKIVKVDTLEVNAIRVDGVPVSADDCFSSLYETDAVYSIITVTSELSTSNELIFTSSAQTCIYANDVVLINDIAYIISSVTNTANIKPPLNKRL